MLILEHEEVMQNISLKNYIKEWKANLINVPSSILWTYATLIETFWLESFEENIGEFRYSNATTRLFVCSQPLAMMTSCDGNIIRVTGLLCGEFTGHHWIPRTKASDALMLLFYRQ